MEENRKINVSIDTDCIISLFSPSDKIHKNMQYIDSLYKTGKIQLFVSLKTIDQLFLKKGTAFEYASSLPKLPNYIVGTIGELVGTIGSLAGTFGDAKKNEMLQQKISKLTRQGVNMRDRQIVIDSYWGGMEILLTNDRDLCDDIPAGHLNKELGLLIMNPDKLIAYINKLR